METALAAAASVPFTADTAVAEVMVRRVSTVSLQAEASELTRIFERGEVAIVIDAERRVQSILTKMDLIDALVARARPPLPRDAAPGGGR